MAFRIDQTAERVHAEINLQSNGQPVSIMAVFRAYDDADDVDGIINDIRRIDQTLQQDPDAGMLAELRLIAQEIFLGWENPENREDLWVTGDNGQLPASPENIERFLKFPGIAFGVCAAFMNMHLSREAALGNSAPLRGNGFRAQRTNPRQRS